jgi:hypothetical protein
LPTARSAIGGRSGGPIKTRAYRHSPRTCSPCTWMSGRLTERCPEGSPSDTPRCGQKRVSRARAAAGIRRDRAGRVRPRCPAPHKEVMTGARRRAGHADQELRPYQHHRTHVARHPHGYQAGREWRGSPRECPALHLHARFARVRGAVRARIRPVGADRHGRPPPIPPPVGGCWRQVCRGGLAGGPNPPAPNVLHPKRLVALDTGPT